MYDMRRSDAKNAIKIPFPPDEKMEEVREYMGFKKLPLDLRDAIVDYYEVKFEGKMFDESTILSELNPILRSQIIDFKGVFWGK